MWPYIYLDLQRTHDGTSITVVRPIAYMPTVCLQICFRPTCYSRHQHCSIVAVHAGRLFVLPCVHAYKGNAFVDFRRTRTHVRVLYTGDISGIKRARRGGTQQRS